MWRWVLRNEVLVFIIVGVILLRVPTLFEPYWYGDEGIYLTIGQAIHRGVELYAGIHDNKPPLLYLVAALANGYQFWFRFITLGWNVVTIVVFWYLAKKWFTSDQPATWATIVFALLTNIPLIEGTIGNAELYFILLTIGAFYWLYSSRSAFVGGLLLGLAALFKMPAILEVGVWPLFWLFTAEKGWFKKSLFVGVGALLPVGLSMAYYASRGTLQPYLIATGLQNIPYLSSWQAPVSMLWRVIIAAILVGVLALIRGKWGHRILLLALWWIVTLFAALLSGRPYPHYLLQMAAVVAIAVTTLVWGKERERYVITALVTVLISSVLIFKFYVYPVASYYGNFLSWVTGVKSQSQYFSYFGSDTLADYTIAQIIDLGSMPNEKIFIWGDRPVIYALSRRLPVGRFTAKYHILDFRAQQETIEQLVSNPPRYIVSFGFEGELPGLSGILSTRYMLEKQVGGASIYRRFDPLAAKKL